ncbi:MAG: hypothetical protein LAT68_08975 [Cyclobacteriaceae bacterium]|nr:hypothetical protein [Cyclobacteriaceae bacterium]MCH8516447.1 hypothetical protein [Cyclobacteriaceae bacterium]
MRKINALLLAFLMAFAFVACSDDDEDPTPGDNGDGNGEAGELTLGTFNLLTPGNGSSFNLELEEDVNITWEAAEPSIEGATVTYAFHLTTAAAFEAGGADVLTNEDLTLIVPSNDNGESNEFDLNRPTARTLLPSLIDGVNSFDEIPAQAFPLMAVWTISATATIGEGDNAQTVTTIAANGVWNVNVLPDGADDRDPIENPGASFISLVGAGTEFGWPDSENWDTDADGNDPIQLTPNDDATIWTAEGITLSTESVKFRIDNAWDTAFGGTTFPGGVIDDAPGGPNIPAQEGTYDVVVNIPASTYMFIPRQ